MTIVNPDIIFKYLTEVLDPEVPVLDIVALGIVRDVKVENDEVEITITPTYSGCPAMKVIEDDIAAKLREKNVTNFKIKTILSPAWTTDWINEEAKEKLRAYGIAPPGKATADKNVLFGKAKVVACPRCGSTNTEMKSQFGSTACKALYFCNDCLEPFDYFKCI
jgi:ring-1,2-phenylacetyl-CoA epoxidase subunit PaaD